MPDGSIVIVGGTGGIGREIARHYADAGRDVVITGRDSDRAAAIATEIGPNVGGIGFDLSKPETIADALAGVGSVAYLVLVAIARDNNPMTDYTIADAVSLATMKLVGYTTVVNVLTDRMSDDSAVLLFGGRAKDRPYPGSTTVTTVNGGVSSLIRTLAIQLAPVRFNALHPGIVGDSPYWADNQAALEATIARTPTKKLATMADVVDATRFLLENPAMNGENVHIDGGWMLQ